MENLKLETFLSAEKDWEINQYKVLGGIKEFQSEFNKKKIYPSLSELISLYSVLQEILDNETILNGKFPKQIVNYDLKNKKIIYETLEKVNEEEKFLFSLIEWALPLIKNAIEEAAVLFEFVEKNIEIEEIGILPLYKDEGYFIIPDNTNQKLLIHRFQCTLFSSNSEKYRTLKTTFIEEMQKEIIEKSPESIKLDLIKKFKDLPNPATYFCETELDFPFNETIFPVAKRKLMAKVAS